MLVTPHQSIICPRRSCRSSRRLDSLSTLANRELLLKTGKVKGLRFSTLNAICKALDYQPGDLLEYAPDQCWQLLGPKLTLG